MLSYTITDTEHEKSTEFVHDAHQTRQEIFPIFGADYFSCISTHKPKSGLGIDFGGMTAKSNLSGTTETSLPEDRRGTCMVQRRSQTAVMEYDKPTHNDVHPTMKPVVGCAFRQVDSPVTSWVRSPVRVRRRISGVFH